MSNTPRLLQVLHNGPNGAIVDMVPSPNGEFLLVHELNKPYSFRYVTSCLGALR